MILKDQGPAPRTRRGFWSRLALAAVPLALLAALEGGLRWRGYGGHPPVIREIGAVNGRRLVEVEARATRDYFLGTVPGRGGGRQSSFYQPKDSNTVRIVLAGESAILGFPQPPPLTAGSFLAWALRRVWPDREVEIINLGTTAVASYPVYDMVRQVLPYDPDLVVVYAGNNEFYGAYGVCSTHYAGAFPLLMRLARAGQALALVQWAQRLRAPPDAPPDRILMERMMRERAVPPDSYLRRRAAENLAYHVGRIADLCRARGVTVMICTLAANERDLAPFGDSDAARAAYRRGRELVEAPRGEEAAAAFQQAIDLDPMPWRPTSLQNEALLRVAREKKTLLFDARRLFREVSPGGCTGWELMDDHVHPSLAGQYLLALGLVKTLAGEAGRLQVHLGRVQRLPSLEIAAGQLGRNVYEDYAVAQGLVNLFRAAMFRASNPQALVRAEQRLAVARERLDPGIAGPFMAAMEDRAAGLTYSVPASGIAAEMFLAGGRVDGALPLLDFAVRSLPEYGKMRRLYAAMLYAGRARRMGGLSARDREGVLGEIQRGRVLLRYGADPSGLTEYALGRLLELLGETAEAKVSFEAAARKDPGLDSRWPFPPAGP
ncbi:MAG: SGNH/GDSL hydrolase family protein [Kiritimatiellae bacterium]|nr:SGNH/GDSL hydrolase family protein [Kiritimatiellia bacterium]